MLRFAAGAACMLACLVLADDGALTSGGTPSLLKGHPTVAMQREKVVLTINRSGTLVDCTFVFHNDGAACDVRMGFPDIADGANATNYGVELDEAKAKGRKIAPYEGLDQFTSWVDGKRIASRLISGDGPDVTSWHVKMVHFAAGQTRIVRDRYSTPNGFGATDVAGYLREAMYYMFTGASWKGPIGYAEVLVKWPYKSQITGYPLATISKVGVKVMRSRRTVFYDGFGKPEIGRNWIRFTKSNFEPMRNDNVYVRYDWSRTP